MRKKFVFRWKSIGLALFMILIAKGSFASTTAIVDSPYRIWIMGVPQYLFENGIRIEIDRRIQESHNWITWSPTIYYRGQPGSWISGNYDVQSLAGMGLEVLYRWYPAGFGYQGGVYVSGGGGYRYMSQKIKGYQWDDFQQDGLTFYDYNNGIWYRISQTYSLRGIVGYQLVSNKHLGLDLYVGLGAKYSIIDKPEGAMAYFTENHNPFTGSGFFITGGFRMGIGW